ncbi:T4S1 protein, partial [Brachypteracias leptosomus]|nr:T4S1 protein [Brachypteracias leptosomus]
FSPISIRVTMCVGKCSRIVGPCLLALGTLSVATNVLLLFPGGTPKYLLEGHISKHSKAVPGIWGGGIIVSTMVCTVSFLTWLRGKGEGMEQVAPLCSPAPFSFPQLALLGAAACFVLSGVGLTNGPLCFYNASEHGHGLGTQWGYPFLDGGGQQPDLRTENYLYNHHTWSTCLEPEGVVTWNVVLFSLLLLISAAEMVLASLQILNGCIGCLCGLCDGK